MNGNDSATSGTTEEPPPRLVYRLPEVGQLLGGLTRNTVKALIKAGELQLTVIGSTRMVPIESIRALIERGKAKAAAEGDTQQAA